MTTKTFFLFLVLLSCSTSFANAGETEKNKEFTRSKECFRCHGVSGNTGAESDAIPKLAGQPKSYLIKAMKDFRSGARQDRIMSLLMSVRTDEEIEIMAEYYFLQKRY